VSYVIIRSDGSTLTTIADGTINTTSTTIGLPGRNYSGYGLVVDTNQVRMLENFATSTVPTNPLRGQLWWKTDDETLRICPSDGESQASNWYTVARVGEDADFTDIIVNNITGNTANFANISVTDTANIEVINANIVNANVGNFVDVTISNTATIENIDANVVDANTGNFVDVTVSNSTTLNTVTSNALTVNGGVTVQNNDLTVNNGNITADFFFGDGGTLSNLNAVNSNFASFAGNITVSDQPNITSVGTLANLSVSGNISALNITATNSLNGDGSNVTALSANNITTGTLAQARLANTSTTLGSTSLTLGGTSSSITGLSAINTQQTITRTLTTGGQTTTGNITGRWSLIGTSRIEATYADLAERFEADAVYDAGTVVELGGEKEVTAVKEELSTSVFGVVSDTAAYLMNGMAGDDETHPPIAVSGRVQVKVKGSVNKGQRLVSAGEGVARGADDSEVTVLNVIGRSLENKTTSTVGFVEAFVTIK